MVEKLENLELTENQKQRLSIRIQEYLEQHWDEGILVDDIMKFYGWKNAETRGAVYNRLYYLAKNQQPPTLKKRGKQFWVIDREAQIIPWKSANSGHYFDIKLPFDLHKYVRLYPRSIMIVGGVSNQGKTTFAHSTINLNWREHKIALWDSENSAEELKGRLSQYPDWEEWPDDFIKDRSENFADVIDPDAINIIDYLEIQDNFWLVGKYIREIRDALKTGIAIINLQKGEGSSLPIGREFSRHLARVVLTIDKGVLTIVKAKDRAQKNINPTNKKWTFHINSSGTHFEDIAEWEGG